ncbi:hypothetical protein SAMN04490357_1050 [Streptomyces misionensis]|uniref:Uncharacterized protein n=1 Tax=Streptomyces misionensis TaxID=67331 RepID=A0A1H4PBW9_9ACTN|nr:hypothetical protein [Streptomyces misionensis]SEC04900.1 hypothetical protein SAMN04490357_1050 [Streptomyces misionensis]
MHRYKVWNGPMPTTAAQQKVTTGTAIKTMLQIALPSTRQIQLISWGFTLDAVPASAGQVELIQTDVAATVTAHVATGLQPLDPNAPASLMTLSTTGTGYTATAEGTVTATRTFDTNLVPPAAGATDINYYYQWMPDERPIVAAGKFLRVRATFGAAVNMTTFVTWDE